MKIHCLQHVPFEGLASIEPWAIERNHSLSATRFYDNELLPAIEDIDWLIVMGGLMNIYEDDRYPWLNQEKRFIEQVIEQDKTVIGICSPKSCFIQKAHGRSHTRDDLANF